VVILPALEDGEKIKRGEPGGTDRLLRQNIRRRSLAFLPSMRFPHCRIAAAAGVSAPASDGAEV